MRKSLHLKSRNSTTDSPYTLMQKHKSLEKSALEMPSAMFSKLKVANFSSTIRRPREFSTANTNCSLARRQNNIIDIRKILSADKHDTNPFNYVYRFS